MSTHRASVFCCFLDFRPRDYLPNKHGLDDRDLFDSRSFNAFSWKFFPGEVVIADGCSKPAISATSPSSRSQVGRSTPSSVARKAAQALRIICSVIPSASSAFRFAAPVLSSVIDSSVTFAGHFPSELKLEATWSPVDKDSYASKQACMAWKSWVGGGGGGWGWEPLQLAVLRRRSDRPSRCRIPNIRQRRAEPSSF